MENFITPLKNKLKYDNVVQIPPSPLMQKIGFGTAIIVYKLERSPLPDKIRSPWAVKKINQIFKHERNSKCANSRLEAEAEILRKLNHPNIVGFRAFTKELSGTNILAMEECTSSLGDLIENRLDYLGEVPYSSKTILKVCNDVTKALDYLHNTALLLHCDIKSYNVLVNGEFEICKLCDFGVCLPLNALGEINENMAEEGAEYIGTPLWCAPEVLLPKPKITTKADIYSYGLVIWEMLALSPPVDDDLIENFDESSSEMPSISVKKEMPTLRQRPPLPDIELGQEYNLILEIYFCCTSVDMNKRPTAKQLVGLFKEVL